MSLKYKLPEKELVCKVCYFYESWGWKECGKCKKLFQEEEKNESEKEIE